MVKDLFSSKQLIDETIKFYLFSIQWCSYEIGHGLMSITVWEKYVKIEVPWCNQMLNKELIACCQIFFFIYLTVISDWFVGAFVRLRLI